MITVTNKQNLKSTKIKIKLIVLLWARFRIAVGLIPFLISTGGLAWVFIDDFDVFSSYLLITVFTLLILYGLYIMFASPLIMYRKMIDISKSECVKYQKSESFYVFDENSCTIYSVKDDKKSGEIKTLYKNIYRIYYNLKYNSLIVQRSLKLETTVIDLSDVDVIKKEQIMGLLSKHKPIKGINKLSL